MDASMVMSKPPPQATTPSSSPTSDAREGGEDFATHLPVDEAPRTPPQRPEATAAKPTTGEASTESETSRESATTDASYTLTAPLAPVTVRPQNSVVTVDLSALLAANAATPAAAPQQAAATQGAPSALPEAAAPPAATTDASAPEAAPPTTPAPPGKPGASLETISLPVAPQAGEARAAPRLRAGRGEGLDTQGADAKPVASVNAAPAAAAPARAGATGVQTASAVQAAASTTAAVDKSASPVAPAIADAAPAEQRAHSLNQTTATHAGHRATTPAALVAQHVIRRFEGRSTSIDVRLDPPELGRVKVSLEVGADNKVTAVVAAENPATLSDLVRSARELERALQDAGLELDAGGLSFDLAERGENENAETPSGKGASRGGGGGDASTPAPVSRPFGLESWRGARIDVMA
ncbi:MAG: flagellar hook-length control protein FliK [Hyphomonadaceae bacterium]|nr:flagellar hook-length control protein FliK [Hyphomonadaceae bacterium]